MLEVFIWGLLSMFCLAGGIELYKWLVEEKKINGLMAGFIAIACGVFFIGIIDAIF